MWVLRRFAVKRNNKNLFNGRRFTAEVILENVAIMASHLAGYVVGWVQNTSNSPGAWTMRAVNLKLPR
jgi:hypothetical protein